MAGTDSVTAREAARDVLALEHADELPETVALMVREMMEGEIAQLAGAEFGERAPIGGPLSAMATGSVVRIRGSARSSWRSRGCGPAATCRRSWSRAGAEQALVAVVQEAYVNGVSTIEKARSACLPSFDHGASQGRRAAMIRRCP